MESTNSREKLTGVSALILAAFFWGGEFVVEKDVLSYVEPNWSNAIRFAVASLCCLTIWRKSFIRANREDWKKGLISGSLMGLGFAFQTMGLATINAGVNAFLCASYILVIPFVLWRIERKKPQGIIFISAVTAIIGIVIMSLNDFSPEDFSLGRGEILTLIGSICYAGGIVAVDYYAAAMDSKFLAGSQCIATFVIAIFMALLIEEVPQTMSVRLTFEFVYLIVFSSLMAQLLFNYGMKYVSSGSAGALFLLESVSALFLGAIFLKEVITLNQIMGSVLIIVAILLSNKPALVGFSNNIR